MDSKKTLVLGASENPSRYSNMALLQLVRHGHPVVAVGKKAGMAAGIPITSDAQEFDQVDTVTLYLNPQNQQPYYNYILNLHPKRIIFNPGTENPELEKMAREAGIEAQRACTLVLLSIGRY